jgi:hypothetical protein
MGVEFSLNIKEEVMMKRKIVLFSVVIAALIFTGWGNQGQSQEPTVQADGRWGPNKVVVMTRNLYVGGNVDRLILPGGDPIQELLQTIAEVQYTNFPERAMAMAEEIKWWGPHLVGLQEMSIINIHLPSFGIEFTLNFEDIFMDALEAKGLDYRVAGKVQNVIAYIPLGGDDYVSLIDNDAVLARGDVNTSNVEAINYLASFNTGPPLFVDVIRGYIAVDAEVGRKKYRFVNTHLEPFVQAAKVGQAQELMFRLSGETLPIILVGDLNTPAPTGEVYQYIVNDNNYVDAWTRNKVQGDKIGNTSGFESTLDDPYDTLEKRIDFILVKSHVWHGAYQDIGPVIAFVVGEERKDMTPSGLWPSDHGGVIARLKIPNM